MFKFRKKWGFASVTLLLVMAFLFTSGGMDLSAAVKNKAEKTVSVNSTARDDTSRVAAQGVSILDQSIMTDAQAVKAAKAALLAASPLLPEETQDSNVIPMVQSIVDEVSSGVVVTVRISYNTQVSRTGNVTYGDTAKTGNVTFKLTKNKAIVTEPIPVTVPASTNNRLGADTDSVAAAKSAIQVAGTFKPVEGQDTNIISMAQALVDHTAPGVTVKVVSSSNKQINSSGGITYGSSVVTGNVSLRLVNGSASATQSISVVVPAHSSTDVEAVAKAKSALQAAGNLTPVEGQDTSVISMAQAIVDQTDPGVTVKVVSSSNSHVDGSGGIIYGSSAVTGSVVFSLTRGGAAATQAILVAVPGHSSAANVKDYGAKGDGVNDDTTAINNAIYAVYQKGGGEVFIPDGVYMINVDTSVKLRSNVKLTMSPRTTLKAKATSSSYNAVVKISNVSNVEVVGGNIVGDRYTHLGTGGAGHGIRIAGSNDISVSDVSISDVWGDGVYIGSTPDQNYSQDIIVEQVKCDNNRRIGITVISAKNLIIRDCVVSHSNGAIPQAGLDFEPNNANEYLENILVENLTTIDNAGYGINFYILIDHQVSIEIDNFTDSGSKKPYNDYMYRNETNPNYHIMFS